MTTLNFLVYNPRGELVAAFEDPVDANRYSRRLGLGSKVTTADGVELSKPDNFRPPSTRDGFADHAGAPEHSQGVALGLGSGT